MRGKAEAASLSPIPVRLTRLAVQVSNFCSRPLTHKEPAMLDFITIAPSLARHLAGLRLTGFSRENTDSGKLYARLTPDGGETRLSLYRDSACGEPH